ncbi:hypothetical protein ACQ4PT_014074 [Festuca glaucescens]
MAPCPAPQPRGSSPSSSLRAPAPSRADRVSSDPSRVLMNPTPPRTASGDAAREASRLKEETQVTVRGNTHNVIAKESTGERNSCTKIEPAPRPKKETLSSTHVSARTVAHGVIRKQKDGENRIRPAVQASDVKDKAKVGSVGVLRNDVIKTKQEASERVQAAVAKSIPPIRPPAPATTNHQDPYAPQDSLRAALAAARQALDRRRRNVYGRQRGAARRELDKVVQTVFFNDTHITLEGVLKSLAC